MRVLEVRFRLRGDEPFAVVGHLVWLRSLDQEPALLRPAPGPEDLGGAEAVVEKVQSLVSSVAPDRFAALQHLRSHFWSLVLG
jgi:hypothetical protein